MTSYCVKCRTKTADVDGEETTTKNGRRGVKSKCADCGTKKFRFAKGSRPEKQGGDIVKALNDKFPDTEFHFPVMNEKTGQVEKANFMGPNTKLEERIKDLEKNAERAWKGEQIPKEDIITPGKSRFDESAMIHDLQYKHASKTGKSAKDVRKMKHKADLQLIRSNFYHALDPNNKSSLDRVQNIASVPMFLIKILGETAYGKITGNGMEIGDTLDSGAELPRGC